MTRRVVIIGGGIAGLAAAYRVHLEGLKQSSAFEVLLLESSPQLGGKVRTLNKDGELFEQGPNAFLDPQPALAELVALSGVDLLDASQEAKRRYLCHDRTLHELSPHPWRLFRTGLLSAPAVLRILCERFIGPRRSDHGNRPTEGWGDESVDAFIGRRFGTRAASLFAGPMVSGVFAGDARKLSISACFPKIVALEDQYGSVIKALRSRRQSGEPTPTLHAPINGMQSLPAALAEKAPFQIRTSTRVLGLSAKPEGWSILIEGEGSLDADAVIVATPASAAAKLLAEHSSATQAALSKITSPHLAVANLVYKEADSLRVPIGFGALHSAGRSSDILGVLNESHIFPARRSDRRLHLRAMLGGATRPDLASKSDSELLGLATQELQAIHGFKSAPALAQITRWQESIPQYHLGHQRLIEDATHGLRAAATPPIKLAGNYLSGVSLSDTAASGRAAGDAILQQLQT